MEGAYGRNREPRDNCKAAIAENERENKRRREKSVILNSRLTWEMLVRQFHEAVSSDSAGVWQTGTHPDQSAYLA